MDDDDIPQALMTCRPSGRRALAQFLAKPTMRPSMDRSPRIRQNATPAGAGQDRDDAARKQLRLQELMAKERGIYLPPKG